MTYVLVGLVTDLTLSFILKPLGFNRAWLANLYLFTEFLIIAFYYKNELFRNRNLLFYALVASVGGYYALHTILRSVFVVNSFDVGMLYFIYIVLSVLGLYHLLLEQRVLLLESSSFFWANVAILIYSSGNFLVFIFHDYLLINEKGTLDMLWLYTHAVLNIVYRLILSLSLLRKEA